MPENVYPGLVKLQSMCAERIEKEQVSVPETTIYCLKLPWVAGIVQCPYLIVEIIPWGTFEYLNNETLILQLRVQIYWIVDVWFRGEDKDFEGNVRLELEDDRFGKAWFVMNRWTERPICELAEKIVHRKPVHRSFVNHGFY